MATEQSGPGRSSHGAMSPFAAASLREKGGAAQKGEGLLDNCRGEDVAHAVVE
jgi:hypothetical protein